MASSKLEQSVWLRGRQSFEFGDDEDVIRVSTKLQGTLNEYQIPLNLIHPESHRFKESNVSGVVCMIVFGALSLLIIGLALSQDSAWFLVLIFVFPLFVVGLLQYKRCGIDAEMFRSRTDGQIILVVWRNLPTKERFETFIDKLRIRLRKVEIPLSNPFNQSVADELRKLGELKKDGILSEPEFEQAKANLLISLEKKEIGFR